MQYMRTGLFSVQPPFTFVKISAILLILSNKSHQLFYKDPLGFAFFANSIIDATTGPHTASSNTGRLSEHLVDMMDSKCLLPKLVYPNLSFVLSQDLNH